MLPGNTYFSRLWYAHCASNRALTPLRWHTPHEARRAATPRSAAPRSATWDARRRAALLEQRLVSVRAVHPLCCAVLCGAVLCCAVPCRAVRCTMRATAHRCVIELFTWLHMGGSAKGIQISPISGSELSVDEAAKALDVSTATCTREDDRDRLLSTLDTAFGGVDELSRELRDAVASALSSGQQLVSLQPA